MRKGQVTIITILGVVVLLIVFTAFLPTLNDVINNASGYLAGSPMAYAMIALIPTFFIIAIIQSMFSYNQRGQ